MYKMPIGIEDFRELRSNGYYFVDKTKLLKEIIDKRNKVTLFARPRRFGKTLTLSMVDCFFNSAYADQQADLFSGTYIASAGQSYTAQAGTKSVIFLTLKETKMTSNELFREAVAYEMRELYGRFLFLLDDPAVSDEDKDEFRRIRRQEASEMELRNSLKKLTQLLCLHEKKPVLLLIDEYDAPIQAAWEHGFYDDAIDFMRSFLSAALKTNSALDFALITGILRIGKESIFSGLNNLDVSTVAEGGYADVFGFTDAEVGKLARECGREDAVPELRRWYDGYDFQGIDMYNPWSVINYFDRGCKAAPYWVNTSGNGILARLLQNADERRWREVKGLLEGSPVVAEIDETVVYGDLLNDRDALYTVLLMTGYLKSLGPVDEENGLYRLAIPNQEIRRVFRREVLSRVGMRTGDIALYEMMQAVINGDAASFQDNLQDILKRTVSVYDTAQPESFYHGLLLGFALYYEAEYRIRSNRESGYGRFDLAMFPKKPSLPGIIMEFKSVKQERDMEKAAENAVAQIHDKAYRQEFAELGVDAVWCYGVAFCGKKVMVKRLAEQD